MEPAPKEAQSKIIKELKQNRLNHSRHQEVTLEEGALELYRKPSSFSRASNPLPSSW